MPRMRTSALQPEPVRNEMRGVSKNLCGKAWGIIFFLPSSFFLRRVSSSSVDANGLPGYLRPLSRQPSTPSHLISPTQLTPHPHQLTQAHPRSLRLPLPIPVPQALLQRRAPHPQLMQLLARVPRPPLPIARPSPSPSPSPSPAMLSFSCNTR